MSESFDVVTAPARSVQTVMKHVSGVSLLLLVTAPFCPSGVQAAPKLSWERDTSSLALLADGKSVWRFRYGKDVPKPMFHPVSLTDGTVLTWDSPGDHPWHHALWFSWKYLNHVNYWDGDPREPVKAGAPRKEQTGGLTDCLAVKIATRENFRAEIAMDLSYHPPGQPVVLRERRTIEISAPDRDGAYHMDWTLTFTAAGEDVVFDRTPIPGEENGVAHGGYAGLSLRFAREFISARIATAKFPVPPERKGVFCELDSQAIDFNGTVLGKEAGIALFDDPGNLSYPTPWYLTIQPHPQFPFLFAQPAVIYLKPYRLKFGQSFTLRYRTAVHSGRWDAATLEAAQRNYIGHRAR